jgi:hypothetical protein
MLSLVARIRMLAAAVLPDASRSDPTIPRLGLNPGPSLYKIAHRNLLESPHCPWGRCAVYSYAGNVRLARELPKNRRRAEVLVSYCGSPVPSAGTLKTLKI